MYLCGILLLLPCTFSEVIICPMIDPRTFSFSSVEDLSDAVGRRVLELVESDKDIFSIALSGGSLPTLLANGLLKYKNFIDFSKWHIFFADERYVDHSHPDSNFKACKGAFLDSVPEAHIYAIDMSVPLDECAKRYQEQLIDVLGGSLDEPPVFDLVMLGMGPDGHTASLFPGHPLLKETSRWVAPISDSPKPPPERITLTYPVINAAKNVIFIATGTSKVDVLPRVIIPSDQVNEQSLPAARVRPVNLEWYIDEEAGAKL